MSEGSDSLSDHDLLIRIDERVGKLDRCMTNHLRHHEKVDDWHRHWLLVAVGVALTALFAAIGSGIVALVFH